MKILFVIARLLLGVVFLVFGLNGFLHFIPMQAPTGAAGQFLAGLAAANFLPFIFAIQVLGGGLLLAGQFVPLALTLLGPIVVNILLFHLLAAPAGIPLALIVTILWFVVFWRVRDAFNGLFVQHPVR